MAARPTLQELALTLGVARSTVSRALRDDPRIGPSTRQRVRRLAEATGYRPHASAIALSHGRTMVIGLLLPRRADLVFTNPYFSELLLGVSARAEEAGYALLLSTEARPDYGAWLREQRVDGLIVLGASLERPDVAVLAKLVDGGAAVVSIHAAPKALRVPTVGSNERAGVWQALAHFEQRGHRRVAFLGGPRGSRHAERRAAAYRSGVRAFGLIEDGALLRATDDTRADGEVAVRRLLGDGVPFTAVLADNDMVAIGAMSGLEDAGLRVPRDVSVIGFDDVPLAAMVRPGLSSVRQPTRQLGELAVDALRQRMAGVEAASVPSVRLATRLVVRETTAQARLDRTDGGASGAGDGEGGVPAEAANGEQAAT